MKIDTKVLEVLSTLECEAHNARITTQLDRKLYTAVNKVLEACGGKWNRKAQAHVFADIAQERIEAVLLSGEVETSRDVGWFPTPPDVSRKLVEGYVHGNDRVLEPSAGDGALVSALMVHQPCLVYAIERDEHRRGGLESRFGHCSSFTMLTQDQAPILDFMDYRGPVEPFDAVMMNPPFTRVGIGNHLDHVRHAHGMLRPEGILRAILPVSVRFRLDKRHTAFREWAEEHDGTFEDLPDDAFRKSGTLVSTCILSLRGA
jgi:hypothetical protein